MQFSELEVDRKQVANLADIWPTLETPIYRVLNEDGVNFCGAQVRPLDEKHFLYVDDQNGFKIVTQDDFDAEIVLASEHVAKGYDRAGNVVDL